MKYIIYLFLFIPFFTFSQVKEIITDSKGNESTYSNGKIGEINPDKLLDLFYKNQEQIKELDRLMSSKFYQQTPYVKFKEIMENKNQLVGKYKSRKLTKVDKQDNGLKIIYDLKVTYEKRNTTEQIVLIKRSEKDNFQIIGYKIN